MTLVQRSTEKPVLNTRLHNPGNTRHVVQTGTENDTAGQRKVCPVEDRLTGQLDSLHGERRFQADEAGNRAIGRACKSLDLLHD